MAFKPKIIVIGPEKSGKTAISNFLSQSTDLPLGEYHPTQGVRILEFESEVELHEGKRPLKVEVELWDCAGGREYENCWTAYADGMKGAIFVMNPDDLEQEDQLEKWYKYFVLQHSLRQRQYVLFAHNKPDSALQEPWKGPQSKLLAEIKWVSTNLEEDPDSVREEFLTFLAGLAAFSKEKQDKEEQGIIGHRFGRR